VRFYHEALREGDRVWERAVQKTVDLSLTEPRLFSMFEAL